MTLSLLPIHSELWQVIAAALRKAADIQSAGMKVCLALQEAVSFGVLVIQPTHSENYPLTK